MNALDDTTLITQFIRGEVSLAANQNLRVEAAFEVVQLLTKRGILLATASLEGEHQTRTIVARQNSDYWQLMHRLLAESRFMLIEPAEQAGFVKYEERPVPAGYQLNCTEARQLWKAWWTNIRHGNRHSIQLELLIFQRNTWYPVREIACNQGTLFVKTLAAEIALQGNDLIAWLQKGGSPIDQHLDQKLPVPQATTQKESANNGVAAQKGAVGEAVAATMPIEVNGAVEAKAARPNAQMAARADLSTVIRHSQGKLYVTTALGEVVIEGIDLKVWLNSLEATPARPQSIDLHRYREREGQAISR
jgi:hypothetical protein